MNELKKKGVIPPTKPTIPRNRGLSLIVATMLTGSIKRSDTNDTMPTNIAQPIGRICDPAGTKKNCAEIAKIIACASTTIASATAVNGRERTAANRTLFRPYRKTNPATPIKRSGKPLNHPKCNVMLSHRIRGDRIGKMPSVRYSPLASNIKGSKMSAQKVPVTSTHPRMEALHARTLHTLCARSLIMPNVAHQCRAAHDPRYETETQSARPLNAPGSASYAFFPVRNHPDLFFRMGGSFPAIRGASSQGGQLLNHIGVNRDSVAL